MFIRHINTFAATLLGTLCLILLPGLCASEESPPAKVDGIPYEVRIKGENLEKARFTNLLGEVSLAVQKKDDPPKSLALLRRRCEGDLPEMQKVLRSFGYFRGAITFKIIPPKSAEDAQVEQQLATRTDNPESDSSAVPPPVNPAAVHFEVVLGPRFSFSKISITLAPDTPPGVLAPPHPKRKGWIKAHPTVLAWW